MRRHELEHVLRAAASVTNTDHLIVIGSQSVLGQHPHAPDVLCVSVEVDLYPRDAPELADLIDGTLGELSPFHETFGYYAQGVGPETAVLPDGWQARLIPVSNANTRGATGWCLEVHDLVVSKLVAGRPKDLRFAKDAARYGLVDASRLRERLAVTPLGVAARALAEARLAAAVSFT